MKWQLNSSFSSAQCLPWSFNKHDVLSTERLLRHNHMDRKAFGTPTSLPQVQNMPAVKAVRQGKKKTGLSCSQSPFILECAPYLPQSHADHHGSIPVFLFPSHTCKISSRAVATSLRPQWPIQWRPNHRKTCEFPGQPCAQLDSPGCLCLCTEHSTASGKAQGSNQKPDLKRQ